MTSSPWEAVSLDRRWAVLFVIVAARIFWGEQVLPTSAPLPFFAYPLLVMTFVGWIWGLVKRERVGMSGTGAEQPNPPIQPTGSAGG